MQFVITITKKVHFNIPLFIPITENKPTGTIIKTKIIKGEIRAETYRILTIDKSIGIARNNILT